MEAINVEDIYEKVNAICSEKCSAGKVGGGCTIRPASYEYFKSNRMHRRGWWGNCNAPACVQWESVIP